MDRSNPRLTRAEYWMLETAVETCYPLSAVHESRVVEITNRASHGLSGDEVVVLLRRLHDEGLIGFHGVRCGADWEALAGLDDATAALVRDGALPPGETPADFYRRVTYYHLTAEGGAIWEAFARPNWNARVMATKDGHRDEDDVRFMHVSLTGTDRGFITEWLREASESIYAIETESVKWSDVGSWPATYWKELASGLRLDVDVRVESRRCPHFRRWYSWGGR